MSTRATYRFRGECGYDHTLYIHHDGYPSGAAVYFAAACKLESRRGGMAERMLRANETAELTSGHDAHGDTKYRYTLSRPLSERNGADVLKAEARRGDMSWAVFFVGSLAGFLNDYGDKAERGTWRMLGRECVTVGMLTSTARARMEAARVQLGRGWTGNASSTAGEVARLVAAGAKIGRDELLALLEETCATFPHMIDYYMREAGLPERIVQS